MSQPVFETHWLINGQQVYDLREAERLVSAGSLAVEVSAEKQADNWKRQQLLEHWHRASLDRYAKHIAEQGHRESPEGQRQAAVNHAAQNPGGIVTTTGGNPAHDELDRYSPPSTDVFKQ